MSDPVTISISRRAKPGRETAFEHALHDFVQRSFQLPGQLGVHIMRPPPESGLREYSIIRKFADQESLETFRRSELYKEWNRTAADLTEGDPRFEELGGLESWVTLPGEELRPLPKWKMVLVTFLGVFPVATLLSLTLGPLLVDWHFLVAQLLFNACVVILLTWVVMPVLTRALHGWIHAN